MRILVLISLFAVCAACAEDEGATAAQALPPATPAAEEPAEIVVRKLEVTPQTVSAGQSATVTVDFEAADPSRGVMLDWHGPRGWLIAFEPVDTSKTHLTFQAPVEEFEKPGRYRAVLRSGTRNLAETWITVTSG